MKVIAWNVSDIRKRGVGGQLGVGITLFYCMPKNAKRIVFYGFIQMHYK